MYIFEMTIQDFIVVIGYEGEQEKEKERAELKIKLIFN